MSNNRILKPLTEDDIELSGSDYANFYGRKPFKIIVNHSWKYSKGAEQLKQRILENERLRAFIIDMRDNPAPISAEQVIDRLTSFTEDLEA